MQKPQIVMNPERIKGIPMETANVQIHARLLVWEMMEHSNDCTTKMCKTIYSLYQWRGDYTEKQLDLIDGMHNSMQKFIDTKATVLENSASID